MTYNSEVLADAPYLYVTFDGSDLNNYGSLGGTLTNGAVPATADTPAGAMSGNSFKFAGSANAFVSRTGFSHTANWTWETWYKKDTTQANATRHLFLVSNTTTSQTVVTINSGTGYLRLWGNNAGMNDGVTVPAIVDGNWHHLAIIRNGSTNTFYVDGASVGSVTGTVATRSNATLRIGGDTSANTGAAAYLDETAFYNAVLTPERIAAHYQAGITAAGVSVRNAVPAMVVNVSTPAPVVTATSPNARVTVPAMTVNVTMPAPISHLSAIVKATAAQINVSTPNAVFIKDTTQRLTPIADRGYISSADGDNKIAWGPNSSYPFAYFDFGDLTVPDGLAPATASLRLLVGLGSVASGTKLGYRVVRLATAFSESSYGALSYVLTDHVGVLSAGAFQTIDVSQVVDAWAAGQPNHGIGILWTSAGSTTSSGYAQIYDRTASVNDRPLLTVTMEEFLGDPVTVTAPAMVASVTMPQHRSGVGTTVSVTGAGSASVVMPDPVVSAIKSPRIAIKAMTITVQFPGGESRNPDALVKASPMEVWLSTPTAQQYISYPKVISVEGAMNASVAMNDATVNLKTDRRIFVTNSMGVSAKMVGIYSKESDRYFTYVPSTVDADDVWLPLDEISGTIAHDIVGTTEGGQQPDLNHGEYVGNPELNVTGAYLRKAVRFDGIDDHLKINYKPYVSYFAPTADTTIEFSLKTTQLNGVLMTGNNVGVYGEVPGYMTDQAEIRLVNGELALYTGAAGGRLTYPVRKFVADGQWHHIILAIPATDAPQANQNATRPHFVAVDGKVVWQRYQAALTGRMAPSAFMARVEAANYAPVVGQVVAGELSNIIVRTNQAISPALAQKLYYEWSETLLIKPDPMTISVSMKDPVKARGNAKRMIALYGLPFNLGAWPLLGEEFNYYSIFAGYYVDTMYSEISPNTDKGLTYHQVRPFTIEDYMVYPVAITGGMFGSGNVTSAPGMEKEGVRDPYTGQFIDDETGLSRFIDLDKDLAEPITNFDAVTVVNYPTATPETGAFVGGGSADPFREPRQSAYALTIPQWQAARDRLRDSILSAAYRGVNLWVNEPWMAEHLGIIQGWDKHVPNDLVNVYPTGPYDLTYTNTRGQELDLAHRGPDWPDAGEARDEDLAPAADRLLGYYQWIWQSNVKRRIVSTEPGLTNLASFERGDTIHYRFRDRYKPHADFVAYDLIDKMNGLSVGDKLGMEMVDGDRMMGPWWSSGDPRQFVVSAKPQGIVGKVISREDTHYYGPNGVVVNNAYKDNALTIAVERGTVVRGQPIKGRIFAEFMAPDTQVYQLPVDKSKSMWKSGEVDEGSYVTTWDFDTRRYRQAVAVLKVTGFYQKMMPRVGSANSATKNEVYEYEIRYIIGQDGDHIMKPYMSMNARGLNWLSVENSLAPGEVKVYAPAMEVDVTTPAPKATQDRSVVVTASAMRVDVELRQPRNFRSNNVSEKATPMVIDVSLQGLGKVIKATPMEITVTAGANARAFGDGDRIYVYLDGQNEVTLFMKED